MNIITYLKEHISAELVEIMASYVNEAPDKTRQALDTSAVSMVAALLKRTSTESGANALFKTLNRGNFDGNEISRIASRLRDREQGAKLIQSGSNLFSHLLPDKRSPLITMISLYVRVRNSSATSILGVLSFMTFDALAKVVRDQKLDAVGLALEISNQKDYILAEADSELVSRLTNTLGIENLSHLGYVEQPVEEELVARTTRSSDFQYMQEESSENIPWRGIITGLAIVGVLSAAWFGWQKYGEDLLAKTREERPIAEEVAIPTDSSVLNADTTTQTKVVASTTTPAATGNSVAAKLTQYLNEPAPVPGKVFVFEGLAFSPATNEPTSESVKAVDEVGEVMKKYPNLQIKFTGVTAKKINKRNVFKQANSIKVYLTKSGIDINRLDSGSFLTSDSTRKDYIILKVVHL
ncbi:MAG: DUF937 domain-containing protein [Siphonobacter sp.]